MNFEPQTQCDCFSSQCEIIWLVSVAFVAHPLLQIVQCNGYCPSWRILCRRRTYLSQHDNPQTSHVKLMSPWILCGDTWNQSILNYCNVFFVYPMYIAQMVLLVPNHHTYRSFEQCFKLNMVLYATKLWLDLTYNPIKQCWYFNGVVLWF